MPDEEDDDLEVPCNGQANAEYTCVTSSGERVTVRGHTAWSINRIRREASLKFHRDVRDVIAEEALGHRSPHARGGKNA